MKTQRWERRARKIAAKRNRMPKHGRPNVNIDSARAERVSQAVKRAGGVK
jgi:hypothetical protein